MMTAEMNTNLLEAPSVQELLNSNRKFDALIVEAFLVEAVAAGLAHKYQAPLIGYGTFMPSYWVNYMVSTYRNFEDNDKTDDSSRSTTWLNSPYISAGNSEM